MLCNQAAPKNRLIEIMKFLNFKTNITAKLPENEISITESDHSY